MTWQVFSRVVKAGGGVVISLFAVFVLIGFRTGETDLMNEVFEKIGTIAEISAIAAFSLWLLRLSFIELKKRHFPSIKWIQLTFKFLKEHHVLMGWVAFSAAIAHGSYFFLQTSEEKTSIYSGLITLVGFAFLVSFGHILKKWGKGKKFLKYKKIHQGLSIAFGLALAVHLLFG